MAGTQSPTVRRRRLALELRRLRESAKLTCEEVAEQLECSASKISRVETGRVSVSPRDVRDMLQIYGVPESQREGLVQLARDSRQKGWWHAYSDTIQPHFATYLGLESAASEIRIYEVSLIPGLLQTEEYARTVISAGMVNSPRDDIERQVKLRMARQPTLTRDDPPKVWAVLDEAALRRRVGGADAMPLSLVPVTLAKGLEFDQVIVLEPARIAAAEARGLHRLYVALTRAVSRLTVLHAEPLPEPLRQAAATSP